MQPEDILAESIGGMDDPHGCGSVSKRMEREETADVELTGRTCSVSHKDCLGMQAPTLGRNTQYLITSRQ